MVCFNGFGQARYTWQPNNGSSSWADGSNWNPARTTPAANDVLVFDGAQTPTTSVTLDFATAQTVGQLSFTNGAQVTLNNDGPRTLDIGAVLPAIGFQVGAGAKVQIVGTLSSAALKVQLAPNVKASIAGRIELSGLGTSGSGHQLLSSTPGAIEFLSGSYLLGGSKFIGFPFGELSAGAGSAIFRSGATFEQLSGGTAFGGKTWSMASFDPGSTFVFSATSGTLGVSNRAFGHVLITANRTSPVATFAAGTLRIVNDLTITAGTHPFNVQNIELLGNIVLNGGNMTLPAVDTNNANAPQASTLNIIGSAAQRIAGTGTITMGSLVSVTLNNAAGLTLQRPLQINANLALTQGLLTTTAANSLTLGPQATTSGGSATSFVNGPLSWVLATANTATDLSFPIGSGAAYRPLVLRAEQTDATATTYTAQQFNQAPAVRAMPTAAGSLQRVSAVRYVNVTNSGAANFKQGTITLNYDADDKVDAPAKLRIAKSDNAGNWLDLGGTGSGAPIGSIASAVAFTSFSDFVLASTEATAGPGNNPLPVSLTSFTARREAAGVRLRWATATERNNSHFEIQHSLDGQAFTVLKKLSGQGHSTSVQEYAWLHEAMHNNSLLYYRLRQVNIDNTSTYSPVVAVQAGPVAAGVFPNPAYDQLNFYAMAGDTYRVLNVLGRPVLTGTAVASLNTLSLNSLSPGIYHLEVVGAQGRVQYRVIKNGVGR
ncbi:T9SS type A sorting domain-containing protein [Hymenobacter sp. PAMC 26628]|uniref:T9SS type A sorting domain-containing protein n=1 Tax=Hymenobacter sp. PAMC 26628 TaxID=1484118 RepID=UPI001F2205E1|nr:T9SS type A sorting domain-containing protein [Hymenobacter sp. PAMC 26628]